MPASKKTMSKTRQLSALVNFVSSLRANRVAHGAGKVSGEPDAIRALLVVIASSDGFAQAQRTPSRKSLRDFSPPSPMAALQL